MKKFMLGLIVSVNFIFAGGWNTDINAARTMAKNRGQMLMVFVESGHCKWCQKMKMRTLNNQRVSPVFNSITRLKVDWNNAQILRQLPTVNGVPATFFIDPLDKEIFLRLDGYRDAGAFLKAVSLAQNKYNLKYKKR